jgi:hypothetical protein
MSSRVESAASSFPTTTATMAAERLVCGAFRSSPVAAARSRPRSRHRSGPRLSEPGAPARAQAAELPAPGSRGICCSARRCVQLKRRPGVEGIAPHGREGAGQPEDQAPRLWRPGGHGRPPFVAALPLVPTSLGAATRQAALWAGMRPNLIRAPALNLSGSGGTERQASQGYIRRLGGPGGHGRPRFCGRPARAVAGGAGHPAKGPHGQVRNHPAGDCRCTVIDGDKPARATRLPQPCHGLAS